jgi:MFS family permease
VVAYKWTVLSNTTLGGLLASLDGSILLISLPVVFKGLGVNPFDVATFPLLIWLLLGYGVVTATLLVTVGRLSDMWGRARMYNFGFAVFSTGSILLFVEPWQGTTGAWALVVFRLIQAVGASFLFANSAALLTDAFPPRERGKAMGVNQISFIGGSLIGLIVGGILASIPDLQVGPWILPTWRLIFLVSVPVGVFGTVWAYLKLKETSIRRSGQKLDLPGNITFGVGLTLLLVGTTYGLLPYGSSTTGWGSPWVVASLLTGAALLVAFVYIELKVPDPMFRLALFKVRSFAAGTSAALLGSLARGGLMLLLVIWFQGIWLPLHGYSFSETPLWAGIFMTPMIVGFLISGPLSGWLSDRQGPRLLSTVGMSLGAASFFALAALPVDFVYWEIGILLFTSGFGMGMFAAPNAAAVMNSVPPENRGAASGMLATLQNTGQQMSLAIFFTVVILGLASGLGGTVPGALGAAGVPSGDAGILGHAIAANPTGALFGAFLGENPMAQLLNLASTLPGWTALPPQVQASLLAPHFFASVVAPGFGSSISVAFLLAGGLTAVAAVISALRGQPFYYGAAERPPEKTPAAQQSSTDAPRAGSRPVSLPPAADVAGPGKLR